MSLDQNTFWLKLSDKIPQFKTFHFLVANKMSKKI